MALALVEAEKAASADEVPVGAVVVREGEVIGTGRNRVIELNDPSAHAEILALREAAQTIGNYRLNEAQLFVTLEPCVMCAGAALHARLGEVIYGAADARWGAAGSVADVLQSPLLNHQCRRTSGVLAEESAALLQAFFATKRG